MLDIFSKILYNSFHIKNYEIYSHNLKLYMAQKNMIKLQCEQCKKINHYSKKNKQKLKDRLELKKLCSSCGTHILHKETK